MPKLDLQRVQWQMQLDAQAEAQRGRVIVPTPPRWHAYLLVAFWLLYFAAMAVGWKAYVLKDDL